MRWREAGRFFERFGFATREDAEAFVRDTLRGQVSLSDLKRPRMLYAAQAGVSGPIKIGASINAAERVASMQTANHERLYLIAEGPGTIEQEREIHEALAPYRIRGEWFRPAPAVIEAAHALWGAA